MLRVPLEASGGSEAAHARLDAGQVPVIVYDGVVDEGHLLDEALHVVVRGQVGAVCP